MNMTYTDSSYTDSSYTDSSYTEPSYSNPFCYNPPCSEDSNILNYKIKISDYKENDIINSRYRILNKPIPCHGTIFQCYDMLEKTPCVLKEIVPDNRERNINKRNEAKLFATLPYHPNIVKLRRLEIVSGSIMMVQDWVRMDLATYMRQNVLKGEQIKEIVLSVCRGLDHCIRFLSSQDDTYYHGDIKPENIFVTSDGKFKLADFGGGSTEGYESPEQEDKRIYKEGNVDFRTDIYSIGKLIQKLCEKCLDTVEKNELLTLAEKCTPKDPDKRIASVQELYKTLSKSELERKPGIKLNISQLLNLVRIGETIDFKELSILLYQAKEEEVCYLFCDAGDVFFQSKSPEIAIELYASAIDCYNMKRDFYGENDPFFSRACASLAKAYAMTAKWDDAIQFSKKALLHTPCNYEAFEVLIYSYIGKAMEETHLVNSNSSITTDELKRRIPFTNIITSLEELHRKFPNDIEPLRKR